MQIPSRHPGSIKVLVLTGVLLRLLSLWIVLGQAAFEMAYNGDEFHSLEVFQGTWKCLKEEYYSPASCVDDVRCNGHSADPPERSP